MINAKKVVVTTKKEKGSSMITYLKRKSLLFSFIALAACALATVGSACAMTITGTIPSLISPGETGVPVTIKIANSGTDIVITDIAFTVNLIVPFLFCREISRPTILLLSCWLIKLRINQPEMALLTGKNGTLVEGESVLISATFAYLAMPSMRHLSLQVLQQAFSNGDNANFSV